MPTPILERIGKLLAGARGPGKFAARRSVGTDDLRLEVKGLGALRLPVSRAQARRLCKIARPARYGLRDETILDPRVRNTWEIPKSRVKIDRRRWNRSLLPVLEQLRRDLGFPDGCTLKAELHNLLVYAPGQFFLPHQDSEKGDDMVGTLVVMMPSAFKGGAIVIAHGGEKVTYRGSKQSLSLIAFYADCHHEVRPVTEGYRVVLTYNLMLERGGDAVASATAKPSMIAALAELMREHFETPLPAPQWLRTTQTAAPEPPSRLVYLLDHEYTQRGLAWDRLKGDDAARVALLRAAAEQVGCEAALALAEVHETWDCMEADWDEPWYGRHSHWEWDGDDWDAGDDQIAGDTDDHTLVDLQDWSITLDRWIDEAGKRAEPIATAVSDSELCYTTPSVELEPYATEYEGFMGNWGNTMDRWYRRAAIVLWPRERAFAVRAEASPAWALEALKKQIRAGSLREAREMSEMLLPFWNRVAVREQRRGFFEKALNVAAGIEAPELAASLLQPFRADSLTPRCAPVFVMLVKRYGEEWALPLLAEWSASNIAGRSFPAQERRAWLTTLPRLCEALRAADAETGTKAAVRLLRDQWGWLKEQIEAGRRLVSPHQRDETLLGLAGPLLGFLEATAPAGRGDAAARARSGDLAHLRNEAVTFLCAAENETLLPCLTRVLRTAGKSMDAEAQGPRSAASTCTESSAGMISRFATKRAARGDRSPWC